MTKANLLIGNICFLLLLFGTKLHAQGVNVNVINQEKITAKPGKVTTVVISISNQSNQDHKVQPSFNIPAGWNSISNMGGFEIKSNSTKTKLLSFITPNQTPAGNYELGYELKDLMTDEPFQSIAIPIEVEEVVNLSIKGMEVPDFVIAGEDIRAKFIVRNFGNSQQPIQLTAYNCDILGPDQLILEPNTIEIVEVISSTLPNLQKVSRKSFRIEGTSNGENTPLAHAYQHCRVIPNSNAEINDIRRLPGHISLSYIGRNDLNGKYVSGWQGEIFARGNLDAAGEKNVELKLRGPNQFEISTLGLYDEYYARFNSPNFNIHVGDKTYTLSPLTEYARNGRGAEASFRHENFELGGFYQSPRFYPEITSEIGAFARHHINAENNISLNYLKKNFQESNGSADMLSLLGRFTPFKHTFIETEVSQGDYNSNTGYGGYFRVESSPARNLRLSSTILYASQNFPGYFTNTWYYTGSVNYNVTPKINLFANVYQDERNAARDTLFSTAPFSERYQAGLSFRLSRKTNVKAYVRQNELKDRLPSLKFHREDKSLKLQISQQIRSFQLVTAVEYGRLENFLNPEGQKFSTLLRTYLDVNYRLSERHNFRGFVQFFENNRFDNFNQQQFIFGISGQSKITNSTLLRFQLQNNFTIEEYYRDRNLMELQLTQRIKRQHEFSIAGRYALQRQTVDQGDFSVAAHYKYKFGIPLEGKEKQSTLFGQIFNSGTESIEGLVLHLNGQTAVTDVQGQFKFKSLAPGKYYLLLDNSSLALHQIPDVQTPIEVEIIEGEDANISFGMTTSVTISGNLNMLQKGRLTNSNPKKVELPSPLLIEISNGEETFRQLTEMDGSFIFSGIRPGKWDLKVIHNELFKQFVFDEETFELYLEPGEKEEIQIRLRKKERKIKFLQSLSLTSKD